MEKWHLINTYETHWLTTFNLYQGILLGFSLIVSSSCHHSASFLGDLYRFLQVKRGVQRLPGMLWVYPSGWQIFGYAVLSLQLKIPRMGYCINGYNNSMYYQWIWLYPGKPGLFPPTNFCSICCPFTNLLNFSDIFRNDHSSSPMIIPVGTNRWNIFLNRCFNSSPSLYPMIIIQY